MANKKRLELHKKLVEILGNEHVYYQAPEGLKMVYPCIRYNKSDIDSMFANNNKYLNHDRYDIIVIDSKPDNEAIERLLNQLPMSSFDRHYTSDNLNHDVITLYY